MKKLFVSLIFALCILSNVLGNGYISMKEKYELNLPQFGICIHLPANAGMNIPMYSNVDNDISFDVKSYVILDPKHIDKPEMSTLSFSIDKRNRDILNLRILQHESEYSSNETIEEIKADPNYLRMLTPLKTKFGQTVSYNINIESKQFDVHQFYYNGYLFVFKIESNMPKEYKNGYEKIIRNIEPKDLSAKMQRYETRQKYNYYDRSFDIKTNPDPSTTFHRMKGKTEKNTTFVAPLTHFSIDIPSGYIYEMDGRKIVERDDNISEVVIGEVDIVDSQMIYNLFRNDSISIIVRYSAEDINAREAIKSSSKNVNYSKQIETSIDGLKTETTYYGSKSSGSTDFYIETENGYYWVSIYGVNQANLDTLDKIIANIRIQSNNKRSHRMSTPLSSQLKLEEEVLAELDNVSLPAYNKTAPTFECLFEQAGLSYLLDGQISDYSWMSITSPNMKKLTSNKVTEIIDEENERMWLSNTSATPQNNGETFSICIDNTARSSNMTEYMQNMKTMWLTYDKKLIDVKEAGVLNINGHEWGLMYYVSSASTHIIMINTSHNDLEIMCTIVAKSKEAAYNKAAFLNGAKFIK